MNSEQPQQQVVSIELEPRTKIQINSDIPEITATAATPLLTDDNENPLNTLNTTTSTPTTTMAITTTASKPLTLITINHKNPNVAGVTAAAAAATATAETATTTTTNQAVLSSATHSPYEIIEPASLPSISRQMFHEAAAIHGGNDSLNFLQAEMGAMQHQQQQQPMYPQQSNQHQYQQPQPSISRVRTASSTLDANTSVSRYPSTSGKHEKKIGHRRVDEGGEVTYKRIQSKQIMGSIQLGIQHTVGSLASKPKRDLLMNDFWEMEAISFPAEGSSITPAHHYNDFRFKVYAPIAFRYFRDLFGIAPDDFLMSMCAAPLLELSNPGASGSIFYLTNDDEFIIKTVQKKECEFLQKLLPGYYMNLSQNPRTLLPKFFGLWCFLYNAKNVRLVAMNNLLPSEIKMHAKYDLKGSTFRRKASKAERQKASPTFKDLDFMEHHPNGIFLETDKYNALMKTIQRDCMVLESFQIMDYSLLVGIHNLDIAAKEKREERIRNARAKLQRQDELRDENDGIYDNEPMSTTQQQQQGQQMQPQPKLSTASSTSAAATAGATSLNRTRSMNRPRLVAHSTAIESITANLDAHIEEDEDVPAGGIPARSENDERLILYIGIIDILQSYRLEKKLEHTFKSIIYNGDTVSVCRPSFYAQRFQNFMGKTVFKKTPTFPLKHSPSKRKTSNAMLLRTPLRNLMLSTPQGAGAGAVAAASTTTGRGNLVSGSSTPPPAFDDISEEDITAASSTTTGIGMSVGSGSMSINHNRGLSTNSQQQQQQQQQRGWQPYQQRSRINSARSILSSNATDDYGDTTTDDEMYSNSGRSRNGARSPTYSQSGGGAGAGTRSPRLSKTNVQLTTIGCLEDDIPKHDNRIVVAVKSAADNDDDDAVDNGINNSVAVAVAQRNNHSDKHINQHLTTTNGNENGTSPTSSQTTMTKTTVVKSVNSQTYTSTLVVNDVIR